MASYTHSIAGCLEGTIGRHGLTPAEFGRWLDPLGPAIAALQDDYTSRSLPHLRIAEETADLVAAEAALAKLSQGADTIVFFGIGGSSLGGQTLAQLGGWHIPGMASEAQRKRPRTRFYDNLDPVTLEAALGSFDLADTRFILISKSGGTPETLVQALAALGAVKATGLAARAPELFLGITEPAAPGKTNGLRTLCEAHDIPVLDHHTGIGGRYSVFTNVGLIAAMARGLDASAVRAGAREVVEALMAATSPRGFAPAEGAASVSAALRASWRGTLLAHLNRYKRFPGGANPGTVQVAFSIDRSGRVVSARLVGGSGDAILDEEAVAMIRRASPVPAPPEGLGGGSIALSVPVKFSR